MSAGKKLEHAIASSKASKKLKGNRKQMVIDDDYNGDDDLLS
jgi:hypothetical protein